MNDTNKHLRDGVVSVVRVLLSDANVSVVLVGVVLVTVGNAVDVSAALVDDVEVSTVVVCDVLVLVGTDVDVADESLLVERVVVEETEITNRRDDTSTLI